jgi:hypothetical protein
MIYVTQLCYSMLVSIAPSGSTLNTSEQPSQLEIQTPWGVEGGGMGDLEEELDALSSSTHGSSQKSCGAHKSTPNRHVHV